jgi:hypothetical protein
MKNKPYPPYYDLQIYTMKEKRVPKSRETIPLNLLCHKSFGVFICSNNSNNHMKKSFSNIVLNS